MIGPALSSAQAGEVARRALADGTEADVVGGIEYLAERQRSDARLWQWTGLLHRALDQRRCAIAALAHAARLAPDDGGIAHGRARTHLEAGLDARTLYDVAARITPFDGDVLLGRAAAAWAVGEVDDAISSIADIVRQEPRWIVGQVKLASMRWMRGDGAAAFEHLAAALRLHPHDEGLWQAHLTCLFQAEDFGKIRAVTAQARGWLGPRTFLDAADAIAASETGDHRTADALFAQLPTDEPGLTVRQVRHLLRTGAGERAAAIVAEGMAGANRVAMAPYAAILWRLSSDERFAWAARQDDLVRVIDLGDRLPPLDAIADGLSALHHARHQHLDQSVRGGTQTDGALFARIDPWIERLRSIIVNATGDAITSWPARDPGDPTLAPRRDRTPRFAGSWSVRLRHGGHHASHVHPEGWLSSAFYVAVPPPSPGQPRAGWLTLGQPEHSLNVGLEPARLIEPKPGRLVLFPSTMWHGTIPITQGERLTIAFDIAHPLGPA